MKRFRMGELYRYARPALPEVLEIDGISNFHYVVAAPGSPSLQLERRINAPSVTRAIDGDRVAVVLLASNEHKRGSMENPWHDTLAPDEGFARYFGDNRTPDVDPGLLLAIEPCFANSSSILLRIKESVSEQRRCYCFVQRRKALRSFRDLRLSSERGGLRNSLRRTAGSSRTTSSIWPSCL